MNHTEPQYLVIVSLPTSGLITDTDILSHHGLDVDAATVHARLVGGWARWGSRDGYLYIDRDISPEAE